MITNIRKLINLMMIITPLTLLGSEVVVEKAKCPQTLSVYLKKEQTNISVAEAFIVNKDFCPIEIKEKFANYNITIFPYGERSKQKSFDIHIPSVNHTETYDKKSMQVKSLGFSNDSVYRLIKLPSYKMEYSKIQFEIKDLTTNKIFKSVVDIKGNI